MRGPHGQSGMALIYKREVDQLFQRLTQWLGRIEAGVVDTEWDLGPEEGAWIGLEEAGDAARQRRP